MTWWNDGNCKDLKNEEKWKKSYDNIKGRQRQRLHYEEIDQQSSLMPNLERWQQEWLEGETMWGASTSCSLDYH